MEPLTLIFTALITGASKATGEAIPDGYQALKALIKHKFESQGKGKDGDYILEQKQEKLEENQDLIKQKLQKVEADKDEEIIQAAQELLKKEDPQGMVAGKYNINVGRDVKADIIGDISGDVEQNNLTIN